MSATAALIIASGVLGSRPSPAAIEQRLKATARDLGPPGPDRSYGYGASRLNLASLAGQNVRFRFRLSTDELVGDYGWYIDDIKMTADNAVCP